jgi:hypothetical protein
VGYEAGDANLPPDFQRPHGRKGALEEGGELRLVIPAGCAVLRIFI